MADYVSREVAHEQLRSACKAGKIVSILVLLLGLCFGGIAAVIALGLQLPLQMMYNVIDMVIDSTSDVVLGTAEAATKAVLLFLMGLFGILACGKIGKTGEPFQPRALKRIKFVVFLTMLMGFLPTLVADIAKIIFCARAGMPLFEVLTYDVEPLCTLVGFIMFMLVRVLAAGATYEYQSDEFVAEHPTGDVEQPDFDGVPDIASVTTAAPLVAETPVEAIDPLADAKTPEEFGSLGGVEAYPPNGAAGAQPPQE